LISNVTVQVPRYVVEVFCGREALGIFAALSYIVIVAVLIFDAISQTLLPRFCSLLSRGEVAQLKKTVGWIAAAATVLGMLGAAVTALFGARVLNLLYGPAFASHAQVLVVLACALPLGLLAWLGRGLMTAAQLFRPQLAVQCSGLIASLAVCYVLIPRGGLYGAGLAVIASFFVPAVAAAFVLRGRLQTTIPGML
jgi:O-antigen/teichoic acid export membrane protein